MPMPEASVYEDNFPAAREHEVGPSNEPFATKAVPVTQFVSRSANNHFRLCIPLPDCPHDVAGQFADVRLHLIGLRTSQHAKRPKVG